MKTRLFSLALAISVAFSALELPVISYASGTDMAEEACLCESASESVSAEGITAATEEEKEPEESEGAVNSESTTLTQEDDSEGMSANSGDLPVDSGSLPREENLQGEDELTGEDKLSGDGVLPGECELPDESEQPAEGELPDGTKLQGDDKLPDEGRLTGGDELARAGLIGHAIGDEPAFEDFSGIEETGKEELLEGSNATTSFDIDVTFGQSTARSMLDMVNEFRTGSEAWAWNSSNTKKVYYPNLKELKYDYGLERVAMQRAAEIAAMFSHARPDGSGCFTAYSVRGTCGENIAAGYWTTQSVFVALREEDDDYQYQGHRRNMLMSSFKYMGVGHVIVDGVDFWVQEFNSVPTSLSYVEPDDDDAIVSIEVDNDEIYSLDVSLSYDDLKMDVGEEKELPEVEKRLVLYGSFYYGVPVHVSGIEYKGYDPDIVSIDPDSGTITAIGEGETSVIVSVGGTEQTFIARVTNNPNSNVSNVMVKQYRTLEDADADTNGTIYSKSGNIDIPYGEKIYLRGKNIPATSAGQGVKVQVEGADYIDYNTNTGELLAKKEGETVITFTSLQDESRYVTIKIRVTAVPISAISFDADSMYMNISSDKSITLKHAPEITSERVENVKWSSSDTSVLEVFGDGEKAVLKSGAKEGKAVITAVVGKLSASVAVNVYRIVDLSGNPAEYIAKTGATDLLKVKIAVSDYKESDLVWTSSDASLISVSDGKITICKSVDAVSKVTITAKTGDGLYSDSFDITLKPWLRAQNPVPGLKTGSVEKNSKLFITAKDAGAEIFYTIDSNDKDGISKPAFDAEGKPINGTLLFDEAITIDKDITVNAVARKEGLRDSEVVSFKYTVLYDWGDVNTKALKALFNGTSEIPEGLWYTFGNEKDGFAAYYTASDKTHFSKTFTGSKVTFNEEIKVFHGNRRLWENRDYTVSYANNTKVASSDANAAPTVSVKGKGSYSGTARFSFTIKALPLSGAMVTSGYEITISSGTKLSSVKPVVEYGGKKLSVNKDYDLNYYEGSVSDSTLIANPSKLSSVAGTEYIVEVVEHNNGNYSGKLASFVVVRVIDTKDKTTVQMSKTKVRIPSQLYDAAGIAVKELFRNGTAKVLYGKNMLEYGRDYDVITYAQDGTVIERVFEAGTYSVLIRGKGGRKEGELSFVGDKSAVLKVTGIAASKVKVAGVTSEVSYKGSAFTLDDLFKKDKTGFEKVTLYTVTGGKTVPLKYSAKNSDESSYDVEISGSGETGKIAVVFRLRGGYTGTIKKTVTVKRADISSAEVTATEAVYCKAGAVPSVSVALGNSVLKEGIDYTLSYKNNTKITSKGAGPLVTVRGIGNYKGLVSREFTIKKALVTEAITAEFVDRIYNGKKGGFKVVPKLTDGSKVIAQGADILRIDAKKDYKYYYAATGKAIPDDAIVPSGTMIECRVEVTCPEMSPYKQGVYELRGGYRIIDNGMNISKASVKVSPSAVFSFDNGRSVIPVKATDIAVTLGKTVLNPSDYEIVSICDSRFMGTVKVKIRGKAPYGGTKTFTFKIGSKLMN